MNFSVFRAATIAGMAAAVFLAAPAFGNDISNSSWSETAASNNAAAPNGWASGTMTPVQVSPTAREMMAAIKRFYNHINAVKTSTGTANVQVLTYDVAPVAYVTGDGYTFKVGAGLTNTASTTLNVNSLGAKTIQIGSTALAGGELQAGRVVTVFYDGTVFQLPARNIAAADVTGITCAMLTNDGEGCADTARAANLVLAGPTGGGSATPTFRAMVTADVDGLLACADLTNEGTACTANTGTSGTTLPFLDGTNTWSGTQTFGPVNGSIGNAGTAVSATTYTLVAGDCGKTNIFTSNSAVTVTIPASIVPATTVCAMAILQAGTAKVSVNGTAVAAATLISDNSFTGTSGTAGNMIGLTLVTVAAQTRAYLTGPGS